jgi:hypothetical protein
LLANGTQTPVSMAMNINQGIPVTTNRTTGQLTVRHGNLYLAHVEDIKGSYL